MVLASRGQRDLDQGLEVVADPALAAAARRQARKVHVMAFISGLVSTAVFLAFPSI